MEYPQIAILENHTVKKDHRPYWLKRLYISLQKYYTNRYIRPQCDVMGRGGAYMKPWHLELFGGPIRIGSYPTVIAAPDRKVRLTVWSDNPQAKGITIGDYCLVCPGVRILCASEVTIGESCMMASGAYITDSDWHGIYDRSLPIGNSAPVVLEENVWVGDSAIICKGVRIGKNSIIGAGAVVASDIPENAIAVGNPAKVIKYLDPEEKMTTRGHWLKDPGKLARQFDIIDRDQLKGNTIRGWVRALLFPQKGD